MHQALCDFNDWLFLTAITVCINPYRQFLKNEHCSAEKFRVYWNYDGDVIVRMIKFTHFLDKGHAKHWKKNPVTSLKFSVSASHDVNVPKLSRDFLMEKRSYWPRLWLNGQRCSLIIYCINIVFNTCMFYFAHDYILLFIMCQFLLSFLLFL